MSSLRRYFPYLAIVWALVILVVSVIPGEDLPSLSIWEPDKVMHAFVYGVLTAFTYLSRLKVPAVLKSAIIYAIVLCISYGFVIEIIQLLLPDRKFDMLDALANSVGCFLTGGIILLISGKKP